MPSPRRFIIGPSPPSSPSPTPPSLTLTAALNTAALTKESLAARHEDKAFHLELSATRLSHQAHISRSTAQKLRLDAETLRDLASARTRRRYEAGEEMASTVWGDGELTMLLGLLEAESEVLSSLIEKLGKTCM